MHGVSNRALSNVVLNKPVEFNSDATEECEEQPDDSERYNYINYLITSIIFKNIE